ncbi:MAG TPA: chemotaxis protein CheW [Burkholderiales bacterium]|nr:chemotaxis protein CheW [Burkholderiales bacterium]
MAQRTSLREYQQTLSERLKNAQAGDAAASKLGIEAGADFWLLDLPDAGEVVPLPALAPVPLTQPWFAGMANIRGNLYAIVDFPAFLGAAPVPQTDQARVLLIGERHRVNSGLLVNRVIGLRRVDRLRAQAPAAQPAPWVAQQFLDDEGRAWKALDVGALVAHPDFLRVEL